MPSSIYLSCDTPSRLAAGRAATSSDTEALFRTNHSIFQAYQAAMATKHNYATSTFIDVSDGPNHALNDNLAAGQLSSDDACARAHTAWSRAYSQNNPEPRYNRPNISGALSIPPMPRIITEYTTSLSPHEYYIFLERCWKLLQKGSASNLHQGVNLSAEEDIPPPITAYSFDLLDLGDSPLQISVSSSDENASAEIEASTTNEIPVDQSTLDELVDLIDELLEDDGASTEHDGSYLEDSDKENSAPPLFFPSYESEEQYEGSQSSSELEGSDKENIRPLSPLFSFSGVQPSTSDAEPFSNDSDRENEFPQGDFTEENATSPSPLYFNLWADEDEELDNDSDKENREPLVFGVLSTLFYDPYAESAQEHVNNVSLEASDEENESELGDSDKENIPALMSPSMPEHAGNEQHRPSGNALMLTFDDAALDDGMSHYEDTMQNGGDNAPIVGIFDNDTDYDSDVSDLSDNESEDSYSEHSNLGRPSLPYSSFSVDIEGSNTVQAALNGSVHAGHHTDLSADDRNASPQKGSDESDESDNGYTNFSETNRYRLTEERATESDIAVASQRRLIDGDQPGQYTILRPIARLPHRLTINGARHQSGHLVEADIAGAESDATRIGVADQRDQNNTHDPSGDEDWTNERSVVFPTSYERTPMHN
ncbi:hypothetical protein D9619_009689 [Psilocybe cf. subviscida]|uniref:Uncharacterized protein n=1 Tax=Psilocybe cf. subviscida TaxID=2480587 RepID=A0A8H5BLX4_9AGAR|nr:hypothetical protein D9619_009689 [Psilocybe cf. subviscida]